MPAASTHSPSATLAHDDSGRSWRSVLDLPDGAGPVAWSKSDPKLAYAVGLNRTLYRSGNGGESWLPVGEGS